LRNSTSGDFSVTTCFASLLRILLKTLSTPIGVLKKKRPRTINPETEYLRGFVHSLFVALNNRDKLAYEVGSTPHRLMVSRKYASARRAKWSEKGE
jgi:hypothetical protein